MPKPKKTWIKLIAMFSAVLELGCAGIPRPIGHIGVVHIPQGYVNQYNMQTDFDDNGDILSTAKSTSLQLSSNAIELDRGVWLDVDSYTNLRAAWKKLKARYDQCQTGQ